MKWSVRRRDARRELVRGGHWHAWFAWHPVKIGHRWFWLEWVERWREEFWDYCDIFYREKP